MARYPSCVEALAALAGGGSEAMCHDFEMVREVAMCAAWKRLESHQAHTFKDALHQSWHEIDAACAAHGGTSPEYGELAAIEHREGPNAPLVLAVEAERRKLEEQVGAKEQRIANEEDCGICAKVLESHCRLHGSENPRYCQLWEEYWTNPNLTPDDVLYELAKVETPEQQQEVVRDLGGTV